MFIFRDIKTKVFLVLNIVLLTIVSCGQSFDEGVTSVNLSGAQYIGETQFPEGFMLYVENDDQPWMKVGINLVGAPSDIPFPNGRYHMALVGVKKVGSNYESYCGIPTVNGSDVITLGGGEVILSATMSKANCVGKEGPFASHSWKDSVNDKLLPLKIMGCQNNAITCTDAGGGQRVRSVMVKLNSFKVGPLFDSIPTGPPIEMCVDLVDAYPNISANYFEIPGGDLDDSQAMGVFNTSVVLYNATGCNDGNERKEFHYPNGIAYSWIDKSVDMSFVINPEGGTDIKLALNADPAIPEALAEMKNGYVWPIGEYISGSGSVYYSVEIENNFDYPMIINSGGVTFTNLPGVSNTGSVGFKGGPWPGAGGDCSVSLNPGNSCTIVLEYSSGASGGLNNEDGFQYNINFTQNSNPALLTGVVLAKPLNAGNLAFVELPSTTVAPVWNIADMSAPVKLKLVNDAEATIFLDSSDFFINDSHVSLVDSGHDIDFSGGVGTPWPGNVSTDECPSGKFPLAGNEYCFIEINNYGAIGSGTYHDVLLEGQYEDGDTPSIYTSLRIRGQEP